jgi:O-antigen ligase
LKFWNALLLGIAALAVGSLYGLDLTGAVDTTLSNAGRLAIGTWLCNNPNSLAHTVIVAIPLSYCLYFWKGGASSRLIVFPLCALLAGTCAYHTQSKGSFLVAGGLLVMVFVIGRPFGVKALALAAAATMGVSALSFLPRMQQMGNLRSDEGVQGRLMAWEMARTARDKTTTGEGWHQFVAMITWEGQTFPKATHSSYVQIGADLGMYGLFLFIAALWCGTRGLVSAHDLTRDDDLQERCRRAAMILIIAYATSSWMINREYHTEYFLIIAVAAAIHRLCQAEATQPSSLENATDSGVDDEEGLRGLSLSAQLENGRIQPRLQIQNESDETVEREFWQKFGFVDVIITAALTWLVIEVWDYVLTSL